MSAIRLDGKALSLKMQEELALQLNVFKSKYEQNVKLVVVLVGNDSASHVYVNNKEQFAKKIGFESQIIHLPEEATQEEVIQTVKSLNEDSTVNGILVQLPLPKHLDEQAILAQIDAQKDVDGFHPENLGNFILGNEATVACTPLGVMTLLKEYHVEFEGKLAVVIGRSNIVGKPMAFLLQRENATVIMAHSRTQNLRELTKLADIVIVAIGKGHFVDKTYIKPGAIVVDVGMNRDVNGKLIGDVAPDVFEVASYMTPVPGGVGPMTITMLMKQTLEQAYKQVKGHE